MTRVFFIASIFTVSMGLWVGEGIADMEWQEVSQGIAEGDFQTVLAHPADPGTLFVGTEKGLYRSRDLGKSWNSILSVRGEKKAVRFLALDPGDANIMFAATESGLYRTADGGESWEKRFEGIGEFSRRSLCVLPDAEDRKRIYLGTGEGLFISQDGGNRFERDSGRLNRLAVAFLAQDPLDSQKLFAATTEGLFRSADRGKGWTRVFVTTTNGEMSQGESLIEENDEDLTTSPEQVTAIAFSPQDPSHLFLSSTRGFYHSLNSGENWERFTEIGLATSDIRHLAFRDKILMVATAEGIYRYSEEKETWERIRGGFSSEKARFLAVTPQGSLWAVMEEGLYLGKETSFSDHVGLNKEVKEILDHFSHEPTIGEIQQAAIRYAEVSPEKILAWRRAAARQAWLPTLSTGIDVGIDRNIAVDTGGTTNPDFFIVGPDERGFDWDVSASWDLGQLIYNDDQTSIDVRSRLLVQLRDDVLDEVTRLYYERRRLQINLLLESPQELRANIEKELKLQELTADIDGLTGGYLSQLIVDH